MQIVTDWDLYLNYELTGFSIITWAITEMRAFWLVEDCVVSCDNHHRQVIIILLKH